MMRIPESWDNAAYLASLPSNGGNLLYFQGLCQPFARNS